MKCIRKTRAGRLCRNEARNGRKTCACHSTAQKRKRRHRARMEEVANETAADRSRRLLEGIGQYVDVPQNPPPDLKRKRESMAEDFNAMMEGKERAPKTFGGTPAEFRKPIKLGIGLSPQGRQEYAQRFQNWHQNLPPRPPPTGVGALPPEALSPMLETMDAADVASAMKSNKAMRKMMKEAVAHDYATNFGRLENEYTEAMRAHSDSLEQVLKNDPMNNDHVANRLQMFGDRFFPEDRRRQRRFDELRSKAKAAEERSERAKPLYENALGRARAAGVSYW
eukprot:jgi/Mesvir1/5671/Mv15689-RA.1